MTAYAQANGPEAMTPARMFALFSCIDGSGDLDDPPYNRAVVEAIIPVCGRALSLMTDTEVLSALGAAFAACKRPEHFTDFRHCCECAEHDELLRSRDLHSLRIEDVGNPGWDPLCFTSAEGLLYYLPALGRLALDEATEDFDWYVPQLHFHLTYEGGKNRILRAATPLQRRAVVRLLRHIVETRGALCEKWSCREDLLAAAELWEG